MANPLPHYRQSQRNFVSPYPRRGGGLPPATTPYHHPQAGRYPANFVPVNPYAHLLGREVYPAQHGLLAWIGDRLNIPEVIILRGMVRKHDVFMLLRRYGVHVRVVGYQAAVGAPWWQPWRMDTYVRVERYHGIAAKAILADQNFEIVNA